MAAPPLLSLVMIVKDEAARIQQTIATVKPYVDRYTILDTGSTDGTQDLIRQAFGETPGDIFQEPFVNFGATRTRALELEGQKSVFALMLSGDEYLEGGTALRQFCEQHRFNSAPEHGAYNVKIRLGSVVFDHPRITRGGGGWYYKGVTHEFLTHPSGADPLGPIPGAAVFHDAQNEDPERKKQSWERDLVFLKAELEKDPTDARTAFYLAQSYDDLERYEEAVAAYQRRVELAGWNEEVYEAKWRMARCARAMGKPWPEVQALFLEAYAFSPHRAEPLYEIAEYYDQQSNHPLTFFFAERAMRLGHPKNDIHFIHEAVYRYQAANLVGAAAYYLGQTDLGEEAVVQVLRHLPEEEYLHRNLALYVQQRIGSVEGTLDEEESDALISAATHVLKNLPGATTLVSAGGDCRRSSLVLGSMVRAHRPDARAYAVIAGAFEEERVSTLKSLRAYIEKAKLSEFLRCVRKVRELRHAGPIGLLFLDGSKGLNEASAIFRQLLPRVLTGGRILIHPCLASSAEMKSFLDELVGSGQCRRLDRAGTLVALERSNDTPVLPIASHASSGFSENQSPMSFAVSIVSRPNYVHSESFREVAETVHHGLLSLGHGSVVTSQLNLPGRRYIVLGSNRLSDHPTSLPPDSILYNLEQVGADSPWMTDELLEIFRRHKIWDYSLRNIAELAKHGIVGVQHVPLGYVPELSRIPKAQTDLDVLFFGSMNERRERIVAELQRNGVKTEAHFGLYGARRDELIARSKIVLNMHYYEAKIFEIVRVSYLLANQRFVVSERGADRDEELAWEPGVAFADYEELVNTCLSFLARPAERERIALTGLRLVTQRSEAECLKHAVKSINSP